MTHQEAHQEHAVITQAELDRLRAELAECRRLLRKHQHAREGYCPECLYTYYQGHAPDCPWQKAMGEA